MQQRDVVDFQFVGQDIPRLLERWARDRPDHPFLVWQPREGEGSRWTYREFWHDVRRVAAGLHERGLGKGDAVLIHSDNCPEMVLAWYACATIGAIAVTTNTRSAGPEITYYAEHAGCVAGITQPRYAALVRDHAPELKWIAVTEDNSEAPAEPPDLDHGCEAFASLYAEGSVLPDRPAEPMLPAGIMYTSGTTSRPKAVVHTHANALWAGRIGPDNIGMTADDTYLIYLPFFHVNAQSWSTWIALGVGATIVLQPKFSASTFWDVVVRHHVTHISLIPFVFKAVAGQPVPENSIKAGVFGLIVPELEQMLGFPVLAGYGMTETVVHCIRGGPRGDIPPRSMGKPTPGYEVLVVDPETEEICAPEQVGELWLRGTRGIQLFAEYYNNPDANAKSFTSEGWFRTGDMVRVDAQGNFIYSERDSDLLKVGGENVSAKEVEDICRLVPGVGDVAVVGAAHEMLGQVPVVFVIAAPGGVADSSAFETAIIDACRERLADFKVPRAVHVVDDFPRATLDKVAKNKLRETADAAG